MNIRDTVDNSNTVSFPRHLSEFLFGILETYEKVLRWILIFPLGYFLVSIENIFRNRNIEPSHAPNSVRCNFFIKNLRISQLGECVPYWRTFMNSIQRD